MDERTRSRGSVQNSSNSWRLVFSITNCGPHFCVDVMVNILNIWTYLNLGEMNFSQTIQKVSC